MFVEDILVAINNKIAMVHPSQPRFGGLLDGNWYPGFIVSVTAQVRAARPLSTNQSQMVLKLISKVRSYIVKYEIASADEIDRLLAYPQHRLPPYESIRLPREARYLGDNQIGLRCKPDPILTENIKNLSGPAGRPRFDWSHKIWIVPVQRCNLAGLHTLLHTYRFHADTVTADYLRLCDESIDQVSIFVFADADSTVLLANIRDHDILAGWITEIAGGIVL